MFKSGGGRKKGGLSLCLKTVSRGHRRKGGITDTDTTCFFPSLRVSSFRENLLVAEEEAKNGNCTVSGLLLPSASVGSIKGFT